VVVAGVAVAERADGPVTYEHDSRDAWHHQAELEHRRWLEERGYLRPETEAAPKPKQELSMNINDAFSSTYISAKDITKPTTLTIQHVAMETVGQGADAQDKPVIGFMGAKKGWILNKTNALSIAELYGDNTDQWIGKAVTLYTTQVQGPNGLTKGIRVMPPAQAAPQAEQKASDAFDDDIPF
jgi:hypothetical protein